MYNSPTAFVLFNTMFVFPLTYRALEEEMILARQERDALNQQLLNTIRHKVALSQEVESWQVGNLYLFMFFLSGGTSGVSLSILLVLARTNCKGHTNTVLLQVILHL